MNYKMKHFLLAWLIAIGLCFPASMFAADVYRLVGQAATCAFDEWNSSPDSYSYRDIYVQIGQAEVKNPPQNNQELLLAQVDIYEGGCDSQGNCSFNGYNSGRISLPGDVVAFGKKLDSASLKAIINVYAWEDWMQENPIPVAIDLAWTPTGERAFRISDMYQVKTAWEIYRERVKETRRLAFVSGTIGFKDVNYGLGPDSTTSNYLIADRIGEGVIFRIR